jgi:hypothetical protein
VNRYRMLRAAVIARLDIAAHKEEC